MARLTSIDPAQATGETRELFDAIQQTLGFIPNAARINASSPAAFRAWLAFFGALAGGQLDPEVRQRIALGVAEATACAYCLAGHTYLAKHIDHLSDEAIQDSRRFSCSDAKMDAALTFAKAVLDRQGSVSDDEVERVRAAGYSDGEIVEIVMCVGFNVLSTYFNNVADTAIDSPRVALAESVI
jgi:uncharacterized peroxidase-related enzyme